MSTSRSCRPMASRCAAGRGSPAPRSSPPATGRTAISTIDQQGTEDPNGTSRSNIRHDPAAARRRGPLAGFKPTRPPDTGSKVEVVDPVAYTGPTQPGPADLMKAIQDLGSKLGQLSKNQQAIETRL